MYLDEYIAFLLGCMLNAFSIEEISGAWAEWPLPYRFL